MLGIDRKKWSPRTYSYFDLIVRHDFTLSIRLKAHLFKLKLDGQSPDI